MKKIPLTQGKYAIVDDSDFAELSKFKWYFRNGYAVRTMQKGGKKKTVRMHRIIVKTPIGMDTDHINRDKLDNRRNNLRICSRAENVANSFRSDNTSGFRGIWFNKRLKKWQAGLNKSGKHIYVGIFKNINEAVSAYNKVAVKYFGEFIKPNQLVK